MIQRDNLHYSFRAIDGYNKAINIVISPREPGKTTSMWMDKIYTPWKKNHKPWLILVRQAVEIDESFINTIFDTNMNKFTDDNIKPVYKQSSFKSGIVDVYIPVKKTRKAMKDDKEIDEEYSEDVLFIRIVSLNIKMYRIKKAILKSIGGIFMDEFIINPKFQEKYLPKEFERIEEAYSTWRREYDGVLKMYFCGNPYSLFNPLFVGLKVPIAKLKRDSFYVGDYYVIHWAVLNPLLRKKLLEENPFMQFDEDYQEYAVEGKAVNDKDIRINQLPKGFYLQFVIKMENKFIGIFKNDYLDSLEDRYHCKFLNEVSAKRTIYCFDFTEMVERSILISIDERLRLSRFKESIRKRSITYEDINVYYYIEEVYKNI